MAAEQVIEIGLSKVAVSRWKTLAGASADVSQICSLPVAPGKWKSALATRSGSVVALNLQFEDARFLAEAKIAVMVMAEEIEALRVYAGYVKDVVDWANATGILHELPKSYEEWVLSQEQENV